jgi:hypothetical protein
MTLFSRYQLQEISKEDVEKSLKAVESYLFRRIICPNYNTNALNKVFCALDSQIIKSKTDEYSYSDICIYILENKSGKTSFPKDDEFKKYICERDIYNGIKKLEHRMYMFDRLENGENREHIDIMNGMKEKTLTVEHIMPQTLTQSWVETLGNNYESIHKKRLHTLANLTLTGYNSEYKNADFERKKNIEHGFRDSGLRLNQYLCQFAQWTEEEMNKRQERLIEQCMQLWPYPQTNFCPIANERELSLEDAEDLTGENIIGYKFESEDVIKSSKWVDMFKDVCHRICEEDVYPLSLIAEDSNFANICFKEEETDGWHKLSDKIYLHTAISNADKLKVLNRLFEGYDRDKEDLVFILKPRNENNQQQDNNQ